jgi:hypothetical protein
MNSKLRRVIVFAALFVAANAALSLVNVAQAQDQGGCAINGCGCSGDGQCGDGCGCVPNFFCTSHGACVSG